MQVTSGGNTIKYTYDDSGSGMLRSRQLNSGDTTYYFWEGYSLYLEKVGSNAARTYFNHPWELGSTVCRFDLGGNNQVDSTDNAWFYLHDEAGNVILITDKDGQPEIEFEQDVWGNDLAGNFNDSPYISQHQTGKLWDAEAGFYFNAARWYDPELGRFVSVSPIAPFSEEEYAFCGNDPVNYVDVNGLLGEATVDLLEERNVVLLGPGDENEGLDSEKARLFIEGINEGSVCIISSVGPGPEKAAGAYLAYKVISRFGKIIRNSRLVRKLIPNAYDIANTGGRHAGKLQNFINMSTSSIKKSIKSFDKGIVLHQDKIKNPERYYPSWNSLSPKARKGNIRHWQKEIRNFTEQRVIAEEVLKQRGE